MDDDDSDREASLVYKKLLPGCKLSEEPIGQDDYDFTVQYLHKCFPKAFKLPKNIDQTLKRTFVLEETERRRKHLTKKKISSKKEGSNRKTRLKKEKKVPRSLNYDSFVQLNEMWKSYITDLLQNEERHEEIQARLNRVDFHGAYLTVVDAHCKDYTGLEGIVVKESKNVFIIVTRTGRTKHIPKAENIFEVKIDNPKGCIKLCGNSLLTRPAERASKKIKSFMEFVGARVYKSRLRYSWPKKIFKAYCRKLCPT